MPDRRWHYDRQAISPVAIALAFVTGVALTWLGFWLDANVTILSGGFIAGVAFEMLATRKVFGKTAPGPCCSSTEHGGVPAVGASQAGDPDDPVWYPYCRDCLEVLSRNHPVRHYG